MAGYSVPNGVGGSRGGQTLVRIIRVVVMTDLPGAISVYGQSGGSADSAMAIEVKDAPRLMPLPIVVLPGGLVVLQPRLILVVLPCFSVGSQGSRQRSTDTAVAVRYSDERRRIDWLSSQVHLEIQMRTGGDACNAHRAKLFASRDGALSLGERRSDHAEMTINANEAVVLNQHFEAAWTFVLETDHRAGSGCYDRCAHRCRQIDAIVVGASLRLVR